MSAEIPIMILLLILVGACSYTVGHERGWRAGWSEAVKPFKTLGKANLDSVRYTGL